MISGKTELIAHIGYPTHSFKSPQIYNPHFERTGVDAVVVPMGCRAEDFPAFLKSVFTLANMRGALITMPHKVTAAGLVDELRPAAAIAGSCNAVRREADGRLVGDLFDGEGFVRGARAKGCRLEGARALVVGAGGVGSAIAAALAAAGVAALVLHDARPEAAARLARRLAAHFPGLTLATGGNDPAGQDLVVNATPLGMRDGDALPVDVSRLAENAFVGEVVLEPEATPLLRAARARGCRSMAGVDMLFEQIPAYLEFFGLPPASAEALRASARLHG